VRPDYDTILSRIVDDTVETVKLAFSGPEREQYRSGALAGLEACRGKLPAELDALIKKSRITANNSLSRGDDDYSYWVAREIHVYWVASVISAVLERWRLPVVVHPNVRASAKAKQILGIP